MNKILELSPDRISLFNYAHLPQLFKTQKQIAESLLPGADEKLRIFQDSTETLKAAGYIYIGMDHFAKPEDGLAIAQKEGELRRNFQGYSTRGSCDLVGFGVSAISSIGDVYAQNYKVLDEYNEAIDTQKLPMHSGIALSQDDRIRQYVINALICDFELDFHALEAGFEIDFSHYFLPELRALQVFADDGLISIENNNIRVLDEGRILVRRICMLFDAYLTRQPEIRYSQII